MESVTPELAFQVTDMRLSQVAASLRWLIPDQPTQDVDAEPLRSALEHVYKARALMKHQGR